MITSIKVLMLVFPLLMGACESMVNDDQTSGIMDGKTAQLDKDYWYAGKAELTRYDLVQNRYSDIHEGEVIRIFVTEDFLTDEQVKNDTYTNPNSVSVLKMNDIRRFTTGLYDYSIMTSVFTRADGSATEKITLSSQDWCGQTFVQLNKQGNKYGIQLRSYFESEGDKNITVKADLLEDEIMNLIRIDPGLIPEGEVTILPSLTSLRFTHGDHVAQTATIARSSYTGNVLQGGNIETISVSYNSPERTVSFHYDTSDHNKIIAWEEQRPSAFDKAIRTTTARKTHELYNAYWQLNSASDTTLRGDLGLE